jgi:polyhydroxyalkanoate synthesis regulator protein
MSNIMETQRDIASFLIRFTQDLWRTPQGDPELEWRGVIRHVQGEAELGFTDFADALKFIQDHLAQLTVNAMPGDSKMDQEKALTAGLKLWEQFASSYSDMMVDAMERTIEGSEALKKQMDRAVEQTLKTWAKPSKAKGNEIGPMLQDLAAQIKTLTDRIDQLENKLSKE